MFRSLFRPFDWDPFDIWDPFREVRTLHRTMDRLFETLAYTPSLVLPRYDFRLDVTERPDDFVVTAVLPGLHPENIDVNIAQDVLTIQAEWPEAKEKEEEENVRYLLRERAGGRLERRVRFPLPVEADQIEASYENGILTVIVPKAEAVRSKRIAVRAATPQLTGNEENVVEGEARVVEN